VEERREENLREGEVNSYTQAGLFVSVGG